MPDDSRTLATLIIVFVPLSFVSIGGGPAIFSELQQQAVVVNGWITQREFADLFAISRAAPGPGALLATLIGWKAAGWLGALVATLAFFVPTSILAYAGAKLWNRRSSRWRAVVQTGFIPISVGLILAGALAVLGAETAGIFAWAIAAGVAAGRLWRPNIHPLLFLGSGAAAFVAFRLAG